MNETLDYMKYDYSHYLREAIGMSLTDLEMRINQLKNISDDPDETMVTGEMQLQYSTYMEVLEQKKKDLLFDETTDEILDDNVLVAKEFIDEIE